MRIAVLAKPDAWHFKDLCRAASERHDLVAVDYSSLSSAVLEHGIEIAGPGFDGEITNLKTCDAVIVRAMPAGSLEQVVFRMDLLGQLVTNGIRVLNPPRTIEAAVDKYLSLALMKNCGIPIPATAVCQTATEAIAWFERLGGDVVVKPVFGSQGRGLMRIRTTSEAQEVFAGMQDESRVFYLQQFIEHNFQDVRAMVIGDQVFGMQRTSPGNWISNASLGAECRAHELDDEERQLALAAVRAVGGSFAGVDILADESGRKFVVEVNACPGWRAFSKATGIDIAKKVLAHLEATVTARMRCDPRR